MGKVWTFLDQTPVFSASFGGDPEIPQTEEWSGFPSQKEDKGNDCPTFARADE